MGTPYQYMLLTSTPEKEARYAALKKTYGSFMAFHGSPMENWHSILHNGLRNMSKNCCFGRLCYQADTLSQVTQRACFMELHMAQEFISHPMLVLPKDT